MISPYGIIGAECELVGWMERLAWPSIPPQTGVDPPEGAPVRESIRLEPGEVSVQHVALRFPSLLFWGARLGQVERREVVHDALLLS